MLLASSVRRRPYFSLGYEAAKHPNHAPNTVIATAADAVPAVACKHRELTYVSMIQSDIAYKYPGRCL
jgi:hypothetical protein